MSVAFASARPRGKGEVTQQTIQKVKSMLFYGEFSRRGPPAARPPRKAAGGWGGQEERWIWQGCGDGRLEREVGEGGGGGGGTKRRC